MNKDQWRYMWPQATGDEAGCQWRDEPPSYQDFDDWLDDFSEGHIWVEKRMVVECLPVRVEGYDRYAADYYKQRAAAVGQIEKRP